MKKLALLLVGVLGTAFCTFAKSTTEPVDYVSPLVGTQSKHALSTGNTYPAIAMPWGMNFWVAQTGKMGDGWAYTYDADKIRGFKQTHQPSPWINDYGQFAIMPVTGKVVFDQDQRASWFSHKAEVAKPYYYKVYLADHDVTTEIAPTSRAAMFRFTFPESKDSYVVVDAFDNGSYVKVIPEENKIIGYTTVEECRRTLRIILYWCSISRSLLPQQLPTATSVRVSWNRKINMQVVSSGSLHVVERRSTYEWLLLLSAPSRQNRT